ncbi:MAG: CRP/FNR family transcriptional regulator [Bacteroidetes bacterium HLUCCA01]|nr:MAG: CRP/FNR family transcriptional regulator [Bacteroidetes bacterium HLUCCA01]
MDNLFKSLNDEQVRAMSANKRSKIYRKGELIFREGDHAAGLFCISRGNIKVFKTGSEGRDLIVRLARSGDAIGYRALISREPYYASAVALEDAQICFVPAEEFFRYIGDNPSFTMELIQTLSRDLRLAEERILRLAQKTVRERLADALTLLLDTFGADPADPHMVNVHLSREDFASLVGTATETVIRLISDFRTEGLIETPGKRIRILDEKTLRQIAGHTT